MRPNPDVHENEVAPDMTTFTRIILLSFALSIIPVTATAQQSRAENCLNQIDDDRDGAIDCQDSDCKHIWVCQSIPEQCANGFDDDGNGDVDCADISCSDRYTCVPRAEHCANGRDDDGDGDVDCADSECFDTYVCLPDTELCRSGKDEDGDGDTDCADEDCRFTAQCLMPAESNQKLLQPRLQQRKINPLVKPKSVDRLQQNKAEK